MITVYVSLDCSSPTHAPDGRFATLVAVSEPEFLRGEHVGRAMRRAAIVGFAGPYHVAYVHRQDAPPMSLDDIRARLQQMVNPRRARTLSIVDQAQTKPASGSAPSIRRDPPKRRRMRGL